MLNTSQSEKIAKKCTTVVLRAMDRFQSYLDESDPESAADIVAGLIKTQVITVAEQDPQDAISQMIEAATRMTEDGTFKD